MFEECVESLVTDPRLRLTRLINATLGDVKTAIEPSQSINDDLRGYNRARQILVNRFGNDHLIFESVVSDVEKNVNKLGLLKIGSALLTNCQIVMKSFGKWANYLKLIAKISCLKL